MCHLDEEQDFKKAKGHIIKCAIPIHLEDPFAAIAVNVGAGHLINQTRFEDRALIPELISAIKTAKNRDEFYQMELHTSLDSTFPSTVRSIKDIAERTKKVLKEEEEQYRSFMQHWARRLQSTHGPNTVIELHSTDFVRQCLVSPRGLTQDFASQDLTENQLFGKLAMMTYLGCSYQLARTLEFMKHADHGGPLGVQSNDMEDCAICYHLDISDDMNFVTGDDGTIRALRRGIAELHEAAKVVHQEVQIVPRILHWEEFQDEACGSVD
jgi:hypothetical protein